MSEIDYGVTYERRGTPRYQVKAWLGENYIEDHAWTAWGAARKGGHHLRTLIDERWAVTRLEVLAKQYEL